MKKYISVILTLTLSAAIAFAVAQTKGTVDKVNSPRPQWFPSGLYTGSDLKNPLSNTINKQAKHLCGTLIYDFPSIPATGANSGCQDSAALTVTGCGFNDTVFLAIDQTIPANNNAGPPVPYVSAANTIKVRICNSSNDGGAIDYPDASYTVCCEGYQ